MDLEKNGPGADSDDCPLATVRLSFSSSGGRELEKNAGDSSVSSSIICFELEGQEIIMEVSRSLRSAVSYIEIISDLPPQFYRR